MAVSRFLSISYCADSPDDNFRKFDIYAVQGSELKPLIVFVHGGAWRSEDKSEHADLAQRLAIATEWPVFVPNYRLSSKANPDFRHPGHSEDTLQFLEFLLAWKPDIPQLASIMDTQNMYLIGHSCSTHMLASVLLDSDFITPTLAPSPQLREAVKGIVFSEGIYDIDALLSRFPNYRGWFIDDAFGANGSYSEYDVNRYRLRGSDALKMHSTTSWLIIHSKGDDLIDAGQSEEMYAHLCKLYGPEADTHVSRSSDKLVAGHDDILRGDEVYIDLVQTFVRQVHGKLHS